MSVMKTSGFQGFLAIAGARDHANVALNFQQRGQSPQHHPLVFCDDHADRLAVVPGTWCHRLAPPGAPDGQCDTNAGSLVCVAVESAAQ